MDGLNWVVADDGARIFAGGRTSWGAAAKTARNCAAFVADDEDEWVADENRSCYNCRYRRWTVDSFSCQKIDGNI